MVNISEDHGRDSLSSPASPLMRGLLTVFCLFLLTACGHHIPAPVEEHSTEKVKRELNADGTYRVRSGDTLYAIAFSQGLDHRDVAKWNGIPGPYIIYPGQQIRLSPPAGSNRSADVQISTAKTPGQTTTRAHTTTTSVAEPSRSTSSGQDPKPVVSNTTTKPPPQKSATQSAATQGSADPTSWKWPTSGNVLRGYVASDPARNGLDISGKEGQSIIATAAGTVVYSGNGLIGYGELIIIKHSEKMLSAYAHNRVRLVQEGEQVRSGQKIAEMGRNDQNEELLHFEIRVRGKPVNPIGYLPKR